MRTWLVVLLVVLLVGCAPVPTAVPIDTVASGPQVEIDRLYLRSAALGESRFVDVYLPPGYADSSDAYPVLYAHDGQDMEVIHLATILQDLYANGSVAPFILIAVHASDDRIREYGIAGAPAVEGIGARAAIHEDFLLNEVIPYIETNYRTLPGPEHTAVMGWSLGGLSAFDLTWNHPDVFGIAGCFSPSFWAYDDESDPVASRVALRLVADQGSSPGLRFWFSAGHLEGDSDRNGDGVIDMVQDARDMVALLQGQGYADIVLLELPEGSHDKLTWSQILPDFLAWVFPP